jgi:hypothetical protein
MNNILMKIVDSLQHSSNPTNACGETPVCAKDILISGKPVKVHKKTFDNFFIQKKNPKHGESPITQRHKPTH